MNMFSSPLNNSNVFLVHPTTQIIMASAASSQPSVTEEEAFKRARQLSETVKLRTVLYEVVLFYYLLSAFKIMIFFKKMILLYSLFLNY
jgi:hypothetical protein